jgi:hypothetical protein
LREGYSTQKLTPLNWKEMFRELVVKMTRSGDTGNDSAKKGNRRRNSERRSARGRSRSAGERRRSGSGARPKS